MKQKMNFAQILRTVFLLSLIVCAMFAAAAQAQLPPNGTVIPTVCFESKPETLTRTLTNNLSAGPVSSTANPNGLQINQGVPPGFDICPRHQRRRSLARGTGDR